jgi:geranylgeranyl reductase family protein
MKKVAVLGGGPAGAFAAERLAAAGLDTFLLDEKLAWEKPCGGGLTYKAYSQYPFLIDNDTPKKLVSQARLTSAKAGTAALDLTRPLVIYSRYDLNNMLLQRAEKAGAAIEKTRVLAIERAGKGWRLKTRHGDLEADYCVVATGARNALRDVGTEWSSANTMTALGYYIPIDQDHVDIEFFPQFAGYLWIFPRNGHLSAGICAKGVPAHALRERLEKYLRNRDISLKEAKYYGHIIPSLERPDWGANRVSGDGWAAVGDAAGFVDPMTGEGLYYAIRSADLATTVILKESPKPVEDYVAALRREFTEDLELASRLAKRLYLGRFLYSDVPARMIQFMHRSPTFCHVMQDLFAGTQNYLELKTRLRQSLNGTLRDLVMNLYFRRLVPRRQ